jgi:hypothetical protein
MATRVAKPLQVDSEGYPYSQARELVEAALRAEVAVLLRGHPGVGKSSLAADVATAMDLPMIDIRLAQRDPAELAGVCFPDHERGVLRQFPPEWVRDACDRPVLVFLDEINAAVTRLHQAAAYQIVLERRVGPFRFHPGTRVMAAGNLEEDNAIVASLSSALCNRFAHFVLRVDVKDWLEWASAAGIDEVVQGYVARYGEGALYENNGDMAFPTPRSWAMASRLYRSCDETLRKRAVSACVGTAAAEKLFSYLRIYRQIHPERVILKGEIPDFTSGRKSEPSFLSAAVFSVAAWLANDSQIPSEARIPDEALPNVVRFISAPGVDPEYAFLFLRQVRQKGTLYERLKALPEFRRLASDLMTLRTELYR